MSLTIKSRSPTEKLPTKILSRRWSHSVVPLTQIILSEERQGDNFVCTLCIFKAPAKRPLSSGIVG